MADLDIERDPDVRTEYAGGAVRQVVHLSAPYTAGAASPTDLVRLYLHRYAAAFRLDRASLPEVVGMPRLPFRARLARLLGGVPVLNRLLWSRFTGGARLAFPGTAVAVRPGESVQFLFPQVVRVFLGWGTWFDIPVWAAGIRVEVIEWAAGPVGHRVTAAYSTLRHDLTDGRVLPDLPATREAAAKALGIPAEQTVGLFIGDGTVPPERDAAANPPAVLVYGRLAGPGLGRELPYREFVDLATRRVIRRDVLASNVVHGKVFAVDPRSQTATPRPRPSRPADELDAFRVNVELQALDPPVGGRRRLTGDRVRIADPNPLDIEPPDEPAGNDFFYTSRSDHFAAVSAYHHCDAALRMVEAVGFPLADYFPLNTTNAKFEPIRVVHRAPIGPGRGVFDGRVVNAQAVAEPPPRERAVKELRFACGDLSDPVRAPLGIAADVRFAWHELGHALLIGATGSPEFPFAHSAGDALAAIICDLDSAVPRKAPAWRGVTFPWVEALRRHDRKAKGGWAWHGSLYSPARDIRDPGGYRGEQVLSSTMFSLYRALGGDATLPNTQDPEDPDLVRRRAAAAYTVYLLVAAIKRLGPVGITPAVDAYALAGAMIAADIATQVWAPDAALFPPFDMEGATWRGGAVHKVVRWALELHGLHAPALGRRPWNEPGEPEPVDLYIADTRPGTYEYTADWQSRPPDVLVAATPQPGADVPPRRNVMSYVFVRVRNRGTLAQPAPATVAVYASRTGSSGPSPWDPSASHAHRWVALLPHPGATTSAVVARNSHVDFGPFQWTPAHQGDHGLLACADGPGDRCNALVATYACAAGPTPLDRLVPFDNNMAWRVLTVGP